MVGGSAEGLEFAGFLRGLGLPVAVMLQPDLLPGFDQKMAQKIENHMIVSGVDFLYHCSLSKVLRKIKTEITDIRRLEMSLCNVVLLVCVLGGADRSLQ